MPRIQIRVELCKKCGQCVDICPEQLFRQKKGAAPKPARPSACISCGHCVSICPVGAVDHSDFPSEVWKPPVSS